MKKYLILFCLSSISGFSQETDWSKKDWKNHETTEIYEPKVKIVTPSASVGGVPSDAKVLFDGKNLDNWELKDKSKSPWLLKEGAMIVNTTAGRPGDLITKEKFGNCQLHVEFKIPADSKNSKEWGDSGNSGVFLADRYELQIFDSYQNEVPIYSNGQCGSIYKQAIPLANACSKPGEWNTYDILYYAPIFRYNGTCEKPATITVMHNGIFILDHFEIQGAIEFIGIPKYDPHGKAPISLQGHGSAVAFKNIWIREL
jgi:hypothetical protein